MKTKLKKGLAATHSLIFRYGLALMLIWLGYMKLRAPGLGNIEQYLTTTIIFSWMMDKVSMEAFVRVFGGLQIIAGLFIALKSLSKTLSAWGGALGFLLLLASVSSFIFSGVLWQSNIFSVAPHATIEAFMGTFILLGVAGWCWSDSI